MFISKKKFEALEKRVAELEVVIQAQPMSSFECMKIIENCTTGLIGVENIPVATDFKPNTIKPL